MRLLLALLLRIFIPIVAVNKNFKGEAFTYLGIKTIRKFYSSMEEEEYIFDVKATTDEFNELKEFYNKLANENLALYIYIF